MPVVLKVSYMIDRWRFKFFWMMTIYQIKVLMIFKLINYYLFIYLFNTYYLVGSKTEKILFYVEKLCK